jgi:hypothetical protein
LPRVPDSVDATSSRSQGAGCLRAFHELFDAVLDTSLDEQAAFHPIPDLLEIGVARGGKDCGVHSVDIECCQNFEALLGLSDVFEKEMLDRA